MSKALQRTLEAKLAALDANPDGDSSSDEEGSEDEHMEEIEESNDSSRKSTLRNKKDLKKATKDPAVGSSVIYIGHLPRGFEEHELKQLLRQFGKIVKLRLVRSKKTGNSRGFAFCEFPAPDVAAVVADTFSGYLVMGQHRLVCHVIASDRVHRGLFHKLPVLLTRAQRRELNRKQVNQQPKVGTKMGQITAGLLQRERKKRDKMKALGIDYFDAFPGYEASAQAMSTKQGNTTTITVTTTSTTKNNELHQTPKEETAVKVLFQQATSTPNQEKNSQSSLGKKNQPSSKTITTPRSESKPGRGVKQESSHQAKDATTTPPSSQNVSKSSSAKKGRKTASMSPPKDSKAHVEVLEVSRTPSSIKHEVKKPSASKKVHKAAKTPSPSPSNKSERNPSSRKKQTDESIEMGQNEPDKSSANEKKQKMASAKTLISSVSNTGGETVTAGTNRKEDVDSNTLEMPFITSERTPAKRRREVATNDKAMTRNNDDHASTRQNAQKSISEEKKTMSETKRISKNASKKKRRQSAP